jgi:aspartate carbamoyltransferase catalytic subunit
MDLTAYERRLDRPTRTKLPELQTNGRLKHVIFADQFDRPMLENFNTLSNIVRELARDHETQLFLHNLLPEKRAMLYFSQASTRTFLSFTAACQLLGMSIAEIRDPSVSSEYKGESPFDSMRMFSSYSDLVVMRTPSAGFAEACAYLMNDLDKFNERTVPIVNGGSGADEHPTQALLDVHTIQRCFEFTSERDSSRWTQFDEYRKMYPDLIRGPDSKVYGFCGDIRRGRTVHSLASLLANFSDVTMYFVSPPDLGLPVALRESLLAKGVKVFEYDTLKDIVQNVDLLYMTRIQWEHDKDTAKGSGPAPVNSDFILTPELVAQMKNYAPILHPFPRNAEIPPEVDHDHRAMYFRQARNGMWVRAALIAHLFDVDGPIVSHHRDVFSQYHNYNTGSN